MRVGFDVSPLARPHPPGLVRVVSGALAELERRERIEVVRLTPPERMPTAHWRQRVLPREVVARGLVGLHSFVSAFAWRGPGARVQTIHELPWRHGVRENADWRHRAWALLGPRRADAVVTASAEVAAEIGSSGKVRVVPWGVGPPFGPDPPGGRIDEPLLGRYRLGEGAFALCPGAVRAKKDLASAIHALACLRARGGPDLRLVVTGEPTLDLRRDLGLASRLGLSRWISTPGRIEDEDLAGLYRLASVVVVLSRSEGFGLPALEALASGTPVVVRRASAQAEVAGATGIVVSPEDPESVAAGLERALMEGARTREASLARAREFSWERTASGLEEVWKEVM